MLCEVIMKDDVLCVTPDDSAIEAAQRMRDTNVGFLPVCDDTGKVLGALTDRDIVIRLVADELPLQTQVGKIMSREIVACAPDDEIARAEELMAHHQKSRIMCVDGEGRLEGIISLSDIAQLDGTEAATALQRISSREARLR